MGGTQNWAVGVCDNGDLYANSTSGSMTQKKGNGNFGMLGLVGFSPEVSPNAHCAQDLGAGFHLDYAGAMAGPYGATVSWANGKGVNLYTGSVSPWGGPGAGGGAGPPALTPTQTCIVGTGSRIW
jgi:hypothetical protein